MGESYRGLTIKIGGDTTGLTKALKATNSAIRQTQSELRKINQGLKFDPTSTKLIEAKIAELGQKAGQASAKLEIMQKTMASLRGTQIEKIATESKNLALAAENARAKYARVDEELARVYNGLALVAKESGVAFDRKDPDSMVASLRSLGKVDDELYAKIQRLKKAHHDAFADNEVHKQALQYKDLAVEIDRTTAEVKQLAAQQAALKADSFGKNRAEVKAMRSELQLLEGTAGQLTREFEAMEAAMRLKPTNVAAAKAAYEALGQKIAVAKQRQDALNGAMDKLRASGIDDAAADTRTLAEQANRAQAEFKQAASEIGEVAGKLQAARQAAVNLEQSAGKGSEEFQRQANEVKQLEQRYESLEQKAKAASAQLDKSMGAQQLAKLRVEAAEAANQVERLKQAQAGLGKATGTSDSALKSLGMTMYATVAPAFMAIGYKSIDAANTIDSSFRDMKKTVNGTEQDFDNLREAALEFSRTHAVSADTILEIEAMGGQLGIAVDKLQDFGEVVSNLDIATNMSADEIAEDLGQLNNILPDLNDNYSAFGDSLVRLGNNMPAQESAIMDITSRIGSLGGIVGMSTPQVLAWATAIAATGQNSEAAGTAISNTMSDIEGVVASGGDALEQFAQVAGMSADDFAKSWNETPSDAMKSFVEGLKRIDDEGGSVDATLQELGITGVRQKQALEGLAQTTDVLNDALVMSEDAWNGVSDQWGDAGDAAREASQKSEGFSGTLQMLKNAASEFGYELGVAMVPFLQDATAAVQTATDVFRELPEPVQRGVVALVGLGAASGALVTMYSSLSPIVEKSSTKFLKNLTMAKATGEAYRILGVDLAAVNTKLEATALGSKGAEKATKALAVSLKALKGAAGMIAVTALVEGIAYLASEAEKAKEKEEAMTEATTGLKSAVAGINATDASDSLASIGDAAEDASVSVDDLAEAHSTLASQIKESSSQVTSTKGQLSEYQQVISDLYGTTDDGAEGYGRLKAAVDGVNSSCGTNYEVVKNTAGAYTVMREGAEQSVDAIMQVIDAQKQQVEAEALMETTKDLYKQKAQDQQAYADQLRKTQEAWDAYNNAEGVSIAQKNDLYNAAEREQEKLDEVKTLLDSSSESYDKATQQQALLTAASNEAASANTKYAASSDELKLALMGASGSSTEFIAAMDNAGISLQQLGDTNQEALTALAGAWDGNMASILSKADELGNQLPQETWDAINNAAASMVNATPAMTQAAASACSMSQSEFVKFAQEAGLSGEDAMAAFIASVQSGADPAAAAAQVVEAQAAGTLGNFASDVQTAGDDGGNSFASALSGTSGTAGSAGSAVSGSASGGLWANSNGSGAGSALGSTFSSAVSGQSGSSNSAGSRVASSAGDGMRSQNGNAGTWGSDLASNFISGIGSMVQSAANKAAELANAVASQIHFSEPEEGVWSGSEHGGITSGRHLVQNFAAGMIAEIGTVSTASGDVAEAAADALQGLQAVPTINVKAVVTEVALADGVTIMGSLEAASLASRAAASSAAANAAALTIRGDVVRQQYVSEAGSTAVIQWLEKNLPGIIGENSPDLVIDNDAGKLIVDNRLYQLQRKAAMNRG